ncbi:unnamed protein product (mitochondrion) [Musa banksii]|jgi:ribulose 1,5-bisphosphate carboxylase large subunit-like protein
MGSRLRNTGPVQSSPQGEQKLFRPSERLLIGLHYLGLYAKVFCPLLSGGIIVWALTESILDDSLLQFGGGTYGHPWGNALGAVAYMVALEASVCTSS